MDERNFIYYEEGDYYTSSSDDDDKSEYHHQGQMTGGTRATKYIQAGATTVSNPYHFDEMMSIASAGGRGRLVASSVGGKKIGKKISNVGKSVGKAIYKEAKPILVAEGKKALKQGIQNMLEHENQEPASGAGFKRPRGRPKIAAQHLIPHQDGGKRQLGKKLGALMPEDLIQEGFKRGLEFARKNSKSGGKFHIGKALKKVAKNEYAQDFASGAVGLGVGAATGNPLLAVGAATGTKAGMDAASGGKRGGGATRGAIVGKIMKEKGLSLPLASKYVKEHNLY